tara:strand:- start:3565 stop:3738 length:174 start_codon:yes stop_codon:yes gene_type:complete
MLEQAICKIENEGEIIVISKNENGITLTNTVNDTKFLIKENMIKEFASFIINYQLNK